MSGLIAVDVAGVGLRLGGGHDGWECVSECRRDLPERPLGSGLDLTLIKSGELPAVGEARLDLPPDPGDPEQGVRWRRYGARARGRTHTWLPCQGGVGGAGQGPRL